MMHCTFHAVGSKAVSRPKNLLILPLLTFLFAANLTRGGAILADQVGTFAGNAQHTANYPGPAQDLNVIRWQAVNDGTSSSALAHYGSPVVTAANTVLVPTKNSSGGYQVDAYEGSSGAHKYTLTSDYVMPSHNWIPSYNIALANYVDPNTHLQVTRLYFPGLGGTVYFIDNPDTAPAGAPQQVAFYGQASASTFASSVFVNTPITADSQGNIFFGFRVQGKAPAPLNTGQSGFARITPAGTSTYVLAATAAKDSQISRDSHNSGPALSADESTLYVAVKAPNTEYYGYLLGLDATALALKFKTFLLDPRNGKGAGILDDSTASPTVGPDGDVYFGTFSNPDNGSRGFLLHFSGDLSAVKTPGGFGWDYTAAIVPASLVPAYNGTSGYLIFSKYNNYAIGDGDGVNRIALLDPNATQVDPHTTASGLSEMREVLTVIGPSPDPQYLSKSFPYAVREWCINTAAVDTHTQTIFTPSEDGHIYRWDLANNSLSQSVGLSAGLGEPYVPTVIGPDGTVITMNGGNVFALGTSNGIDMTLASSSADVRFAVTGQAITFTATVKNGPAAASGSVSFQDVYYPVGSLTSQTIALGSAPLDSTGQAAVTAQNPGSGIHFIAASYNPGSGVVAGVTRVQKVHSYATTTSLSASPNPANSGQTVAVTATVTSIGGSVPTGQVTFMDGATILTQVPLNSAGAATFTSSTFSLGNHALSAAYASDPVCAGSPGSATLTVQTSSSVPSKPTGLQAASGPGRKQISLKWNPNPASENVTGYDVLRSPTGATGTFTRIATVTGTTYVDALKSSGLAESYYIVAENASGSSVPSDPASGTSR
jgi:hypothetical protein